MKKILVVIAALTGGLLLPTAGAAQSGSVCTQCLDFIHLLACFETGAANPGSCFRLSGNACVTIGGVCQAVDVAMDGAPAEKLRWSDLETLYLLERRLNGGRGSGLAAQDPEDRRIYHRSCDGAVLARLYSAERAAELRKSSSSITI